MGKKKLDECDSGPIPVERGKETADGKQATKGGLEESMSRQQIEYEGATVTSLDGLKALAGIHNPA